MKKVASADLVRHFEQIPNVGKATAADFLKLGLTEPQQLARQDALDLYQRLCNLTGVRHDPCVLDVFAAAIAFMQGEPTQAWWYYSQLRLGKTPAPESS